MNKIRLSQSVRTVACSAVCAFMFFPPLSHAAIDEFGGPAPEQMMSGEVKNEMVLIQRLDERTLLTDSGRISVPYSVQLTDTRNPDDWYTKEKAKVVFYFTKNLEMVRVVISE